MWSCRFGLRKCVRRTNTRCTRKASSVQSDRRSAPALSAASSHGAHHVSAGSTTRRETGHSTRKLTHTHTHTHTHRGGGGGRGIRNLCLKREEISLYSSPQKREEPRSTSQSVSSSHRHHEPGRPLSINTMNAAACKVQVSASFGDIYVELIVEGRLVRSTASIKGSRPISIGTYVILTGSATSSRSLLASAVRFLTVRTYVWVTSCRVHPNTDQGDQ